MPSPFAIPALKLTATILLLNMVWTTVSAQYFFTGEVDDEHGDKLQQVSILVKSTGYIYQTGLNGDFSIRSRSEEDSLTFLVDGYSTYSTVIHSSGFLQIMLKPRTALAASSFPLLSVTNGMSVSFTGEQDGISYNMIRRFLDRDAAVPSEAVKIEELLNYFNPTYREPDSLQLFGCSSRLLSCPWNRDHQLLFLNMCARKGDMNKTPPGNLVFLIDASGSMDMPNKMPLIKAGFRMLVRNLRESDTVSLVTFGGQTAVVLQGVSGSKKEEILSAIDRLTPDGPSPGQEGIKLAYMVARQQFIEGGNNRVVLVTDGDLSGDMESARALAQQVREGGADGIKLSCFGVGIDSVQDSELPVLAKLGQGNFGCIKSACQAEKKLLSELEPGLATVAEEVLVTAGFDTSLVRDYRLIGFDNRPVHDSAAHLQGSSLVSGHSMLAIFELSPKKDTLMREAVAGVTIHYTLPGKASAQVLDYHCPNQLEVFEKADIEWKRAACIALFGMKLKGGDYTTNMSWAEIERMTKKTFSGNNYLDREYLSLVNKARKIYEHQGETASAQ